MKKLIFILPILIIVVAFGLFFYANQETENQIDLYIERAVASGTYKDIQYSSADISVDGTISVTELSITDPNDFQYIIDQVEISDLDFLNPFPNSISISASGFSLPNGLPEMNTSTLPQDFDQFMSLMNGADSIPAVINYSHQYDPDDNNSFSSVVGFGLPESFNVSLNTKTLNIPYETLNQLSDPNTAQTEMINALMRAEVPELSLTLSDFGLLDDYLSTQATQQGRNVDVLREELISMSQTLFLFVPQDLQETAINLSAELSSFLEGNKSFNLSLRPDFSGSIQQLQVPIMTAFFNGDYAQIVDLLNLEFFTE